MSNSAIVSYLPSLGEKDSTKKQYRRLSNALKQYYLDADLKKLNESYVNYIDLNERAIKNEVGIGLSLINALSTFNIAPSYSYNKYMSVIKNKTDLESIKSDWELVGDDLNNVWIDYIINARGNDE